MADRGGFGCHKAVVARPFAETEAPIADLP